jgi:hypothetical protein
MLFSAVMPWKSLPIQRHIKIFKLFIDLVLVFVDETEYEYSGSEEEEEEVPEQEGEPR